MAITKEQLKAELKQFGVKFNGNAKDQTLAKLLVETLKTKDVEISEELLALAADVAVDDKKTQPAKKSDEEKHKMLCNVRHDGVLYEQGKEYAFETEVAEHFTAKKYI